MPRLPSRADSPTPSLLTFLLRICARLASGTLSRWRRGRRAFEFEEGRGENESRMMGWLSFLLYMFLFIRGCR